MMWYISNIKGNVVTAVAGLFVLASVVLGFLVHPYIFLFTGWVGFMLVLASATGVCPMFWLLKSIGRGRVLETPAESARCA